MVRNYLTFFLIAIASLGLVCCRSTRVTETPAILHQHSIDSMSSQIHADKSQASYIYVTDSFYIREVITDTLRTVETRQVTDRSRIDTVIINHDSIVIQSRIDSIPFPVEVIRYVEVKKIPWYADIFCIVICLGTFLIGIFIGKRITK